MTRTILLADDSVTIQKVVELTFMDEDFRVVSVGTGTEAIERLGDVAPDVVIADVHMPGADGYEVAEHVRAHLPGTPVLLLAGTFEIFDAERAEGVGAAGHLKKPFDSQELLRRVREMIESAPAPSERVAAATPALETTARPFSAETSEVETLGTQGSDWSIPVADDAEEAASWSAVTDEDEDAGGVFDEQPVAAVEAPPEAGSAIELAPEFVPEPSDPAEPESMGAVATGANGSLSDDDVERIARRIAELIGDKVVREVAWEVVPDLAEVLLKARIRELESSVE